MLNFIKDELLRLFPKLRGLHKSWTVWINTAIALIAYLADNVSVLQQYLPNNVSWIAGAIAIVNLMLRFKTTNGLEQK